jgi:hypothetical protein
VQHALAAGGVGFYVKLITFRSRMHCEIFLKAVGVMLFLIKTLNFPKLFSTAAGILPFVLSVQNVHIWRIILSKEM